MNWKRILQLSLFGVAMGAATVFLIPPRIEPFCWLIIFLLCAWLIARGAGGKPFLHGLYLGLVNSLWITAIHMIFLSRYLAAHPQEAEMMKSTSSPEFARLTMLLTGPVIGAVSGAIIGVFALIAARFVRGARLPA